ncbi:MAG: hypothetical protein KIT33_08710 [Candidatus Kapabacteria bacterium]|nr:hypothetical protein [Ignavibacteriota bacterium]MCW5885036.1 hypothetical protein [Candidatus Kapabacteria bacterium]
MINNIGKIKDFIIRNSIWLFLAIISLLLLSPAKTELRTFFLIIAVESLAIALSAVALKVYTSIDFTQQEIYNVGQIFTGVHICVGLTVLGVYIAQFAP